MQNSTNELVDAVKNLEQQITELSVHIGSRQRTRNTNSFCNQSQGDFDEF